MRKARQNQDKQRRAFEQYLAARLEILRGAQNMGFGQAGFVAGPLLGGAGATLVDILASAAGGFIGQRFGGDGSVAAQMAAQPVTGLALPPGFAGPPASAMLGGGGLPTSFSRRSSGRFSCVPSAVVPSAGPQRKMVLFRTPGNTHLFQAEGA